jgi:hypothetical protein
MEVARHWRLKKQRYALEGSTVTQPQAVGAATNGQTVVRYELERPAESISVTGTVYSFSVLSEAAAGFSDNTPYIMGMIELDNGELITAQLTDLDSEPEIGMRVEMVTRKLRTDGDAGMIVYGYKFRPLLGM